MIVSYFTPTDYLEVERDSPIYLNDCIGVELD